MAFIKILFLARYLGHILVTFKMTKITSTAATPMAHPPMSIFHRSHLVSCFSTG